jgi:hypothetical protein
VIGITDVPSIGGVCFTTAEKKWCENAVNLLILLLTTELPAKDFIEAMAPPAQRKEEIK